MNPTGLVRRVRNDLAHPRRAVPCDTRPNTQRRFDGVFAMRALLIFFSFAIANLPQPATAAGQWSEEFGWWQGPDARIRTVASYAGDIMAAGDFLHVGRLDAAYLARWDGVQWHALASPFSGPIDLLTVYDGALIAIAGMHVERWDGVTWQQLSGPGTGSQRITATQLFDGKLIVAGFFSSVGGVGVHNVASWDGAQWSALGLGVSDVVNDIAAIGSRLYVAGIFTSAGAMPAQHMASWDGISWSALGSGTSGPVNQLGTNAGELFASGTFNVAGGRPVQNMARWDGINWIPTTGGTLPLLLDHGSELLALRNSQVLRWNGADWEAFAPNAVGVVPQVTVLASDGAQLLAGGTYPTIAGVTQYDVARWDSPSWTRLSPIDGLGFDGPVYAFAVYHDTLLALGAFSRSGTTPINGLAQWDGSRWLPFGPGIQSVSQMLVHNGELFVGGSFRRIGDTEFNSVARWNGSGWSPLGNGVGYYDDFNERWNQGSVNSMVSYRGELVVAGDVARNTVNYGCVVGWDGAGWHLIGPGIGGYWWGLPATLSVQGDSLFAGGDFEQPVRFAAVWDGNTWTTLGDMVWESQVRGLMFWQGALLGRGYFEFPGGATFGFMRWDGAYWNELPGCPADAFRMVPYGSRLACGDALWDGSNWTRLAGGVNGRSNDSVEYRGSLWVGGNFSAADGKRSFYVARWDDPTSDLEIESLEAMRTESGVALSWRVGAAARGVISGVDVEVSRAPEGPYTRITPRPLAPQSAMSWTDPNPTAAGTAWYRLRVLRDGGADVITRPIAVETYTSGPGRTELFAIADPGAGQSVSIRYRLARSGPMQLTIFDVRGRVVRTLEDRRGRPGSYLRQWDRRDGSGQVAQRGVYFVRLSAAGATPARKLVLHSD